MKNRFIPLAFMIAAVFAACEQTTKKTISTDGTETVEIRTPVSDTVDKQETPPAEVRTVNGTVEEINNGKDGYTAKIKSADGSYAVTISRANLSNPDQYKSVAIGEKISVTGDYWTIEGKNQITVRKIN